VNNGNQAGFAVTVTDSLDLAVTLDPTSFMLNGVPLSAEVLDVDTGDSATKTTRTFQVNIGAVAGMSTSVLTFDTVVSTKLTSTVIVNQALVSGDNFQQVYSTAPDNGVDDIPTSIDLNAVPLLDVTLTWNTTNGESAAPGGQIVYTISVTNLADSTAVASNVMISDVLDSSLMSLDLGSVVVVTNNAVVKQGNSIKDSSVLVYASSIDIGEQVVVSFSATLVNTFPAYVNSVSNQAQVSGDNFATQLSRDPMTAILVDPTVTPVEASPIISISLSSVYNGNDVDTANPIKVGGTYQFIGTISNVGNQLTDGTVVTMYIDANSVFVAGSVTTNCGKNCKVTKGNYVGNQGPVVVELGSLSTGTANEIVVSYLAIVNDPFAGVSPVVVSEVDVSANNIAVASNSAPFPVNAAPQLTISMTCDYCLSTGDRCSSLNPGDNIQMTATIKNSGTQNAFDVLFLDNPGSPFINVGGPYNVVPASAANGMQFEVFTNGSLQVTFPSLSGEQGTVSFSYLLQMTNSAPATSGIVQTLTTWSNDGVGYFSGDFDCSSSSSRSGSSSTQTRRQRGEVIALARSESTCPPTFVPCSGSFSPNIASSCGSVTATLAQDIDQNGIASTGDVLSFTVTLYIQSSCADLTGVSFTDIPDPVNARLVAGSVRTTFGRIASGNSQDDSEVVLYMGELPGKRQLQIAVSFEVLITGNTLGFRTLGNTGFVTMDHYGTFEVDAISPEIQFTTDIYAFSSAQMIRPVFFSLLWLLLAGFLVL